MSCLRVEESTRLRVLIEARVAEHDVTLKEALFPIFAGQKRTT